MDQLGTLYLVWSVLMNTAADDDDDSNNNKTEEKVRS